MFGNKCMCLVIYMVMKFTIYGSIIGPTGRGPRADGPRRQRQVAPGYHSIVDRIILDCIILYHIIL